jgi:hypothetical protein
MENMVWITLALAAWALDLSLDCANLGRALRPVAWLLGGGSLSAPLGSGRPESPWRCPAGGIWRHRPDRLTSPAAPS